MNGRANKGGERGMNGEWYEGGQFLPSSETTVKGAYSVTIVKGTKKEIAPYIWQESPADDTLSIYDLINHFCTDNRRECQYVKGHGFTGFKFTGIGYAPFQNDMIEWIADMIEKYNSGERWISLQDDPYHYKNQK